MPMLSLEEPIKLERFGPVYKAGTPVPIDLSSLFLDDTAFVTVQAFFQNDATSPPFPLLSPPISGFWGIGPAGAQLKKKPGDIPTKGFTPPVPGLYTVTATAVSFPGAVLSYWKSAPFPVEA